MLTRAFTESAGALGLFAATLAYEGEPTTAVELDQRLDSDIDRGVTGAGPHLRHPLVVPC